MNKTLFGLALLNFNWEKSDKDIVDSYIPLVCSIIRENSYSKVERNIIQYDLSKMFGINVPLGAIESILKRMAKQGSLQKTTGDYTVIYAKISSIIKPDVKEELDSSYQALIIQIKDYAVNEFGVSFSVEDCEIGLISFFKEYDVDLLFANDDGMSVLPQVKESKKIKYIIAKFITYIKEVDPGKFRSILKLAKGYLIASLITYTDLQSYSGTLEAVSVFIDAPLVFNLIGINGDSSLKLSQEMIKELLAQNANLKIFEVNYNEVIGTIQDAISKLRTGKYDLRYSSRILRTSVREGIPVSTLQIKLNQVESILKQLKIQIVSTPPYDNKRFNINEARLTDIIKGLYNNSNGRELPFYKTAQIDKDVTSLSAIFRLRKDTLGTSLKSCKAILITNNEQIAFASKVYEREDWEYKSIIPPCVTDIFLSTILWANYPGSNDNLNVKRLMSECYSIMELDSKLLSKYYKDVEKLHNENTISQDEYYMLTATNLAYNLLERKTLNDFEDYTDTTAAEILENIQLHYQNEAIREKSVNDKTDNNIKRISKILARVIFALVGLVLAATAIFIKIKSSLKFEKWYFEIIYYSISAFIAAFGILRWSDWIPTRSNLQEGLSSRIYKTIKNVLSKN